MRRVTYASSCIWLSVLIFTSRHLDFVPAGTSFSPERLLARVSCLYLWDKLCNMPRVFLLRTRERAPDLGAHVGRALSHDSAHVRHQSRVHMLIQQRVPCPCITHLLVTSQLCRQTTSERSSSSTSRPSALNSTLHGCHLHRTAQTMRVCTSLHCRQLARSSCHRLLRSHLAAARVLELRGHQSRA